MQSRNQIAFTGMETLLKVFKRVNLAITLWFAVITMAENDKDNYDGLFIGPKAMFQNAQRNLILQEDIFSKSYEKVNMSRSDNENSRGDKKYSSKESLDSVLQGSQSNLKSTSAQEDLFSNSNASRSFPLESRSNSYESRSFQLESRSQSYEPRSTQDYSDDKDYDDYQDYGNDYYDFKYSTVAPLPTTTTAAPRLTTTTPRLSK